MITNTFLRQRKIIVLTALAIALSACVSQAYDKEAALLPADSTQARAEIVEIISQSFKGKKIPIAADVFQHSSRLLLGQKNITSPEEVVIIRSENKTTITFKLVKQGNNCLLQRMNTEKEWQLKTKSCFKQ